MSITKKILYLLGALMFCFKIYLLLTTPHLFAKVVIIGGFILDATIIFIFPRIWGL